VQWKHFDAKKNLGQTRSIKKILSSEFHTLAKDQEYTSSWLFLATLNFNFSLECRSA
jgi:hypothetical protein